MDLAVGCTYKYLNGGPGAPAFLYVRRELQAEALSPIWGWFGQRQPFAFDLDYEPAEGMARFLVGDVRLGVMFYEYLASQADYRGLIRDGVLVIHPAVERLIPATMISPLDLVVPFIRDNSPLETYAVTAEDMAYLVDLYGLELAEGHLPHPNSNEVVIPWTAAKNRSLHVGDVIGDPDHPMPPIRHRL